MSMINPLQELELIELEGNMMTEEEQEAFVNRFQVRDLAAATWCFRKLQAMMAKAKEINVIADAEVQRIEGWRASQLAGLQRDIEFFETHLKLFHEKQLAENPKQKTISTPYGALKSTTRKPSPKMANEEDLLDYLKAMGEMDYIVVKEKAAWSEYKKTLRITELNGRMVAVDENGVEVLGVEIESGGTTFKVEVSE